jgi:DNA-binding transcriptional regulator YiaG
LAERRRAGLSAADFAKLVGVTLFTVYNWEHGKSLPRNGQVQTLAALLGLCEREATAKMAMLRNGEPAGRRRRPK